MRRHRFIIIFAILVIGTGCYMGYGQMGITASLPLEPQGALDPETPEEAPNPSPGAPPRQSSIERAALGEGLPEEELDELMQRLESLEMPLEGARVTHFAGQLPGAPRTYRNGIHQGLDFYSDHCGIEVKMGTPLRPAAGGIVIRADNDFVEMSPDEHSSFLAESLGSGQTPDSILDRLNGRQIWIEHDGGIITRYSHLSSIVDGIEPGLRVSPGQVIAYVGNSGTSDGVKGTQEGAHLHLEIVVDGKVFFDGMDQEQVLGTLKKALE